MEARPPHGDDTRLTRVGRWMSLEEQQAMERSGMVQEGSGGMTHVAHPADPVAYERQAPAGDRYVEFDVPAVSLRAGGAPGWAIIAGPNSLYGRLALRRGEPVPQLPPVRNVEWKATRI